MIMPNLEGKSREIQLFFYNTGQNLSQMGSDFLNFLNYPSY